MGLTPEQEAHLRHLKREVELTKRKVMATRLSYEEERNAIHAHYVAEKNLAKYAKLCQPINDTFAPAAQSV